MNNVNKIRKSFQKSQNAQTLPKSKAKKLKIIENFKLNLFPSTFFDFVIAQGGKG